MKTEGTILKVLSDAEFQAADAACIRHLYDWYNVACGVLESPKSLRKRVEDTNHCDAHPAS